MLKLQIEYLGHEKITKLSHFIKFQPLNENIILIMISNPIIHKSISRKGNQFRYNCIRIKSIQL